MADLHSRLRFVPMTAAAASAIAAWRYGGALTLYDGSPDDIPAMLDPVNRHFVACTVQQGLIGFCCFGASARVPGGAYPAGPLDVGLGLRPDLLGQGQGTELLRATLRLGRERFAPFAFRTTVAAFNERSLRMCRRAGFREVGRFFRPSDGLEFLQLAREEPPTPPTSPH